jgi:CheY-like chemotaxis protein
VRVLIVEDDIRNVDELKNSLVPRFGADAILFVLSRDSAIQALKNETFDLVVLDRKIPTADSAFDPDIAHGDEVYQFLRHIVLGTPVRFWTALPDDDYWDEKAKDVSQEDIWGSGNFHTVGFIGKSHPERIEEAIEEVRRGLVSLDQVVLNQKPGTEVELSSLESRVLKVFAKRLGGDSVEVAQIAGGLSGAKVFFATTWSGGKPTHRTVGKLTSITDLRDELERHQQFHKLNPGLTPSIVLQIRAGAGNLGGTFYQLAGKHERSFFNILQSDQKIGSEIASKIKDGLDGWFKAANRRTSTIREVRQQFARDSVFAAVNRTLPHLQLEAFEEKCVSWNESCCHGDLHGENILYDDTVPPIIIDFGDVGQSIAARDPVTLELCNLFHPKGRRAADGWPSLEQAKNWHDLAVYLDGCPYPDFVRLCRNWAYEWGGHSPALYACAYGYLVRQCRYPDTDKALAGALIESIVTGFRKL